ncbi:D-2-hydroxyacid dehydrogenase [bacterium]|nr:MAG: D-2-hydroxyacid dehydrogenase [bacterium]
MSDRLTIWCNADLGAEAEAALREGTAGHQLVMAGEATSNLAVGGHSKELEAAQIAFGQPDATQAMEQTGLRWVHITSAGYTRYDTDAFKAAIKGRGAAFTNSSSVFDDPCAQHLLAFMLAQARQLPQGMKAQLDGHRWDYGNLRGATRLLNGTAVLLGYGAIAKRLVELLSPFGMDLVGIRRSVRGDETIPTYPLQEVDSWLAKADHVVNILPASPSTDGFFDADRIAKIKPGAVLTNVGRGTTVDQEALIAALESGHLAAAYLDVTDPEPLPADHPLWSAPNCFITPHIAGGFLGEATVLVEHFLENLRRFERGEDLKDRIV